MFPFLKREHRHHETIFIWVLTVELSVFKKTPTHGVTNDIAFLLTRFLESCIALISSVYLQLNLGSRFDDAILARVKSLAICSSAALSFSNNGFKSMSPKLFTTQCMINIFRSFVGALEAWELTD